MSFAAIGIAVGTTALSVGLSASGALTPSVNQPNLASASQQLSDTEAGLLPIQRGMSSAAATGGKFTFTPPPGMNLQQFAQEMGVEMPQTAPQANGQISFGEPAGNVPHGTKGQSTVAPQPPATTGKPGLVRNPDGSYTVDFNGYGQAQTQGTIASQEAAGQLALAQQYDPAFIASALQQEQEADPQGAAARQAENALIQQQIQNNPDQPVADLLQSQITSRVNAGKGLDDFDTSTLNNAVQQALGARGGGAAGADYAQPLTTGLPGAQRQLQGEQEGISELGSGTTPEDVTYRREQQNLANLSAQVNAQTPESEFRSLSSAQSGPTPGVAGPAQPLTPGDTTGAAASSSLGSFGTQLQNLQRQSNPWLAGISTLLSGAGAAGSAGFKPLAQQGQYSGAS
jgi:hypothetical protein